MRSLRERTDRTTELLSPAGSFDSARAAVNAGADAIYMGGPLFSARAFAESSEDEMLLRSIEFCHMRGVRVFMTLNTLIKDSELCMIEDYLRPYHEAGLDGVIVQDLGVMRKVKELYPDMELHISTQAAVTGWRTAKRYMELGAKRIVLARELSLGEIRNIKERTGAELEVFAHGALCYSYSGNCLMSSFIGGRSGNRGKCAGTCRLPFNTAHREQYLLSMCDLNTVSRLVEMIEAGVYSFKIEGRMKSPVYTAAVTSVYRKYLDIAEQFAGKNNSGAYKVSRADSELLTEVFDRTGFTNGYLDGRNGPDMLTLKGKPEFRSHNDALIGDIRKKYIDNDSKLPVKARIELIKGRHPVLTLTCVDESNQHNSAASVPYVTVSADIIIEKAGKQAATADSVREKIARLGDTDFELAGFEAVMEDDCFVPVSTLNELRRAAADELKKRILKSGC